MVVYTPKSVTISIALFVFAGACEIGGGWLVWKWRKDGWHWGFFLLGSLILVGYGLVPTLQEQDFGRTYAAYGGAFIVLSLMWGWGLDGNRPDKWDAVGAAIAIVGVVIIMFVPRGGGDEPENAMAPASGPEPFRAPSPSPSTGV